MWTKILLTAFLIEIITCGIGLAGSIVNLKRVCKYAAIALFIEIMITIILVIIMIWT